MSGNKRHCVKLCDAEDEDDDDDVEGAAGGGGGGGGAVAAAAAAAATVMEGVGGGVLVGLSTVCVQWRKMPQENKARGGGFSFGWWWLRLIAAEQLHCHTDN